MKSVPCLLGMHEWETIAETQTQNAHQLCICCGKISVPQTSRIFITTLDKVPPPPPRKNHA